MSSILKFRPRTPPQRRLGASQARFNVACWGRQSGKTTFGSEKMIWKPLRGRRGGIYWHVLQTYSAAEVVFDRVDRLLFKTDLIRRRSHESNLCIFLENGANVFYKSGDKPHNLRTETLDGAILDECRQQQKETWSQVLMPMLGRYNGWCDFYSTPNGFDWFFDLFEMARLENPDGEWATFQAPSTEAWWWDQAQIAQARATMTEDEFAQEILAEFREIGKGKAYKNHGAHNQVDQNPWTPTGILWSPYLPIIVGLDFNVGLMCWELMQHKGEDFYNGDEIAVANTHSQEVAPLLVDKVRGHKPGVILIGDASGKSQHTSSAGVTDYSTIAKALREASIPYRDLTPDSNPHVKDRVNLFNSRLRAADGKVHYWYNQKRCKHLKKDLERVSWKEGTSGAILDKSNALLTHASDAGGYPVAYFAEELRKRPGVLRVIPR